MRALGRGLRRFGLATWDFLVGDTPEVLVVTLATVALAYGVRAHNALAVVLLPLFVAVALIGMVRLGQARWRAKRQGRP